MNTTIQFYSLRLRLQCSNLCKALEEFKKNNKNNPECIIFLNRVYNIYQAFIFAVEDVLILAVWREIEKSLKVSAGLFYLLEHGRVNELSASEVEAIRKTLKKEHAEFTNFLQEKEDKDVSCIEHIIRQMLFCVHQASRL